jgi:hypothetical protein
MLRFRHHLAWGLSEAEKNSEDTVGAIELRSNPYLVLHFHHWIRPLSDGLFDSIITRNPYACIILYYGFASSPDEKRNVMRDLLCAAQAVDVAAGAAHLAKVGQLVWRVLDRAPIWKDLVERLASGKANECTHVVPGAGTRWVGALVALELVDQDTGVVVVVDWANTAGGWAGGDGRAVGLPGVLESTGLVGPGASTTLVSALVTLRRDKGESMLNQPVYCVTYREDVDQDTVVTIEVERADTARNTRLAARDDNLASVATSELEESGRSGVVGGSHDEGGKGENNSEGSGEHDCDCDGEGSLGGVELKEECCLWEMSCLGWAGEKRPKSYTIYGVRWWVDLPPAVFFGLDTSELLWLHDSSWIVDRFYRETTDGED